MYSIIRKYGPGVLSSIGMLGTSAVLPAETVVDGSWFIEAGVSNASSSLESAEFAVDGDETGWTLGVGYSLNRLLAVQVAYHDLGSGHAATDCPPPNVCLVENLDTVDISGYSLAATGSYPVTDAFDVFGRVGLMSWDVDFDNFARDASGEDVLFGVGVAYTFADSWRLSLQYEDYGFDVDSASVGISRRFGGR